MDNQSYKQFMKAARQQTGWDIQQIKDALVAHFGHGFNKAMTQQYMGHLLALKENVWDIDKALEKYKPEPCPICGKPAKGTTIVSEGFLCEGKLKHYWRWRVEKLRSYLGYKTESGRSGLSVDTGEDTVLERPESDGTEGIQGATPARLPSE